MTADLDMRLLRVLAILAETGSFTRTAARMNITQSAVSHGMKRLESQVGCALLYKRGKTTHLTPEGRQFLTQVQRTMESLDRAVESVSGRFSDSRGTLTVVFSTAMAQRILAPVLREFRDSYPRISVVVRLEDTPAALRLLEEGRCDLAIAMDDRLPAALSAKPLFADRIHFVFSPLHAWASKERLSAREMSQEHFLLYQRQSATFERSQDFFSRMGIRLASHVEIPNFEIMKQLARLGLGVALMAPWVAADELAEGSLRSRPLPRFPIKRRWAAVFQSHRILRQPEQTFIGLCRMACATLGAEAEKG
jgi:DNA-binding transcriptional LysR family regulator